jgi:hypothetical protein
VWIEGVSVDAEQEVAQRRGEGKLADVTPSLVALCSDLGNLFARVAPQKATVEFGMSFKVEASGLALLVAKAGAEANFKVTLEWSGGAGPPAGADLALAGAPTP